MYKNVVYRKAKKQKAKQKKVFCQVLDILCNVLWYFLFIDRTYIYVCTNSLDDTIRPMISMTITMIESMSTKLGKGILPVCWTIHNVHCKGRVQIAQSVNANLRLMSNIGIGLNPVAVKVHYLLSLRELQ